MMEESLSTWGTQTPGLTPSLTACRRWLLTGVDQCENPDVVAPAPFSASLAKVKSKTVFFWQDGQ